LTESQKNQQEAIDLARRIGDTQQILIWQTIRGVDLVTQGNYDDAKAVYLQELTIARNVGDKQATSDTLQNLGVVFLQTGGLNAAEEDTAQSLDIARKARLRNEELGALSSLGDIQMARGNLSGARKSYDEGLKLTLQSGDEGNAANCRLGLAKLAIENGEVSTAEMLSRQASETFEKYALVDPEGDALNTLARAFLAQGKPSEARVQIDKAGNIGVQDQVVKLSLAVTAAKLDAQTGNIQGAAQTLASNLADAKRMKLLKVQLEIRLAQVEIDSSLHGSSPQPQLQAIEQESRSAGFTLIAANAAKRQHEVSK
jgi:tetratricopeptide (TPR) repeat protein